MEEESVEVLRDVFKCFICMEKLNDARLCPRCSKFCCFQCICRWMQQSPQCPHCRANLRIHEFIKCRWAEEVTDRLDTLNNSTTPSSTQAEPVKDAICDVHNEKLSVFCWTCQSCICHHCALWGGQHQGHTLKPLEDEYGNRVNQISQEVKKLRRRLFLLIKNLQELDSNIEIIRSSKEERISEMRYTIETMINRLEVQMKNKLVSLTGQKRSLAMEVEMVEGILSEVEHTLSNASHPELIQGSAEMFKMLTQIQRSNLSPVAQVSADFVSEVVPPYESQTFLVEGFEEKRRKADPVYSTPLLINGLTWRLKVYPDGNGAVRGTFISVFLELTHGPPEQSRYEYRVEMTHQESGGVAAQNIIREFGSEFEVGECWGYNRFFKIEYLQSDGFLHNDTLLLKFFVRPPTYYQKCKDLLWYISEVESGTAMQSEGNINESDEGQRPITVEAVDPTVNPESEERRLSTPTSVGVIPAYVLLSTPEENLATDRPANLRNSTENKEKVTGRQLETSVLEKDVEEEEETRDNDNDVEDEMAASGGGVGASGGGGAYSRFTPSLYVAPAGNTRPSGRLYLHSTYASNRRNRSPYGQRSETAHNLGRWLASSAVDLDHSYIRSNENSPIQLPPPLEVTASAAPPPLAGSARTAHDRRHAHDMSNALRVLEGETNADSDESVTEQMNALSQQWVDLLHVDADDANRASDLIRNAADGSEPEGRVDCPACSPRNRRIIFRKNKARSHPHGAQHTSGERSEVATERGRGKPRMKVYFGPTSKNTTGYSGVCTRNETASSRANTGRRNLNSEFPNFVMEDGIERVEETTGPSSSRRSPVLQLSKEVEHPTGGGASGGGLSSRSSSMDALCGDKTEEGSEL